MIKIRINAPVLNSTITKRSCILPKGSHFWTWGILSKLIKWPDGKILVFNVSTFDRASFLNIVYPVLYFIVLFQLNGWIYDVWQHNLAGNCNIKSNVALKQRKEMFIGTISLSKRKKLYRKRASWVVISIKKHHVAECIKRQPFNYIKTKTVLLQYQT